MSEPPPPDTRRDTLLDAEALVPPSLRAQPPPAHAPDEPPPNSPGDDPDTLTSRAPDGAGTFERTPLVYVLVHILDRRFTGVLVVRTETGATASLTLRGGAVVRIETRGEGDRLGEEALATGACSGEELASALALSQERRTLLGSELVHEAAVLPETVRKLILAQTLRRVATLVNLPPATTYALHVGKREAAPHEPWAPLDVLLAAVRAWSDRQRIHGTIRFLGAEGIRLHPEGDLRNLLVQPPERQALEALRQGEVSLGKLYRSIGGGLSSLVYVLAVTRQLVSKQDDRPPMGRREAAAGPPAAHVVVMVPLQTAGTESLARADTLPEFAPVPVPRTTAPYPLDPGPSIAMAPAPVQAPVPKSTLVSATLPARAAAPPPAPPQPAASNRPVPSAPASRAAADDPADPFKAVDAALARHDLKTAEEHALKVVRAAPQLPENAALFAWVCAHAGEEDSLPEGVRALTRIVEEHPKCEPALYYRGMLLKRAGKDKAALRDFVTILYENPTHVQALGEVREIRKRKK